MTSAPGGVIEYLRRLAVAPALASEPDEVLLRLFAQERDEAAFAALLHRHGPMVLAACRRLLPSAPDAEDAFQGTFLVLARRAAQVGRPERLAPWLYGVALRVARKLRQRPATPLPAELPDETSKADRELAGVLDEELARLPARYREPLVLCCLEGLSRDEAARRLRASPIAVKGLLERGRERLRRRLARRGFLSGVPAALPTAALPPGLASATVAGVAGGEVPAAVAVLVKGVIADMSLSRMKPVLALALVALACSGVGLTMQAAAPATSRRTTLAARPAEKPKAAERPADPRDDKGQPERIRVGDYLHIQVWGDRFPNPSIDGPYRVEPAGTLPLGAAYGRVKVKGLKLEEAEKAVQDHLRKYLKPPLPQVQITWGRAPGPEGPRAAALERRVEELEKEVRALRKAIEQLRKKVK
jgi:RNA polymerase sigma factor (sigma-70 family)